MSYQAISQARSHRVPFHGLGRAPGYMNGCAGCGPGMGAGLEWIGKTAEATAKTADIIAGGDAKRARTARDNMLAAQATAGAAGQTAAAQVEIARIHAETERMRAGAPQGGSKTPLIIGGVVLALLVVGGGIFLLKK